MVGAVYGPEFYAGKGEGERRGLEAALSGWGGAWRVGGAWQVGGAGRRCAFPLPLLSRAPFLQ